MQTFIKGNDVNWTNVGEGMRRKVLAYNQEIMTVEVEFDEGGVGKDHSHPHAQITYVISGEYSYHIEGEARIMRAGDSIAVEGGKVHGLTCIKAGRLLDVFSPMREDFVR